MGIKVLAPAKINLGLEIGKKSVNGYHEVDMIMQSISICDEINIDFCQTHGIQILSDKKINCPPEKNIAYRAAQEFFEYTQIKNKGVKIKIKKNIPMCAGLAGGSADGAGVIVGLNRMFGTNLGVSEMCKIGSKIGSDVPFCIMGGAATAKGIGTELTQVSSMPSCVILIVKPNFSISTAEAYARFDSLKIEERHSIDSLEKAIKCQNLRYVCGELYNRFEEVINVREIFEIKQKLLKFGALGSLMTGSGSAVYGIFDDDKKAETCLSNLQSEYEFVGLAEPVNHGAFVV